MFEDDDEDRFESDKFDECWSCKHRFCEWVCDDCGVGENFEEDDPDEVDKDFVV
jgi:hypothetical protein